MWQDYTPDCFEVFNISSRPPQIVRRAACLETRPERVGGADLDIVLDALGIPHSRLPTGVALDDVSESDIEEALGRPVVLAATMSELLEALKDRGESA
jgi:hypothetical protein